MQPSTPQLPTDRQAPVPPHRPLTRYYGEDAERERYVADLFNKTAKHYNTVEKLFGNGGLLYRRLALRRAGLQRGMKVLDVAMGTAAVGRGAAKIVGPRASWSASIPARACWPRRPRCSPARACAATARRSRSAASTSTS